MVQQERSTKTADVKGDTKTVPAKCVLDCNTTHQLDGCPKFKAMSVQEHWWVVKRFKRCTYCFGRHFLLKCRAVVP